MDLRHEAFPMHFFAVAVIANTTARGNARWFLIAPHPQFGTADHIHWCMRLVPTTTLPCSLTFVAALLLGKVLLDGNLTWSQCCLADGK